MSLPAPVHFATKLPPFRLACGVQLRHHHAHGWAWGPDTEALAPLAVPPATAGQVVSRDAAALDAVPDVAKTPVRLDPSVPTVLLVHALTGDAVPGGPDGEGWWGPLIGPGKPLDPTCMRLLCFNLLGSCYGSHGPADHGFPTRAALPPAKTPIRAAWQLPDTFPAPLSAWDQARAQWLALHALGIAHLAGVMGGSVGGFVAFGITALHPGRVGSLVALATDTRSTPWTLGFNHLGRQALVRNPGPVGLSLARQVAHLSYRANPGLFERQGRGTLTGDPTDPRQPRRVQTYLQHHGHKLTTRYDWRSYLAMIDAMDRFDLEAPPAPDSPERWNPSGPWGLDRLHAHAAPIHLVALSTDQLYPPERLAELATELSARPAPVHHHLIDNPHGHDAFLMDWPALEAIVRAVDLHLPAPGGEGRAP